MITDLETNRHLKSASGYAVADIFQRFQKDDFGKKLLRILHKIVLAFDLFRVFKSYRIKYRL